MNPDGAAVPVDGDDRHPLRWTPVSDGLQRIAEARATRDVLTGLPNRAVLVDRIDQALAQDARTGGCSAVVLVAIDRYEQVTEAQGRAEGDALLRRVSSQLVGALRMMDTVGRVGGNEFLVLAPRLESPIHAVDMSARWRRSWPAGRGVARRARASPRASASPSRWTGAARSEVLLHEAGVAVQRARALGGARAEVYDDSLWLRVQQRWIARQVLQAALDDHRVVVHYQPIVDVGTGRSPATRRCRGSPTPTARSCRPRGSCRRQRTPSSSSRWSARCWHSDAPTPVPGSATGRGRPGPPWPST